MKNYIFTFYVLQSVFLFSQTPSFTEINLINENEVNDIVQDQYGCLWIATNSGIIVYNGFEEIHIALPKGSNSVNKLELINGKMFVGTKTGNVFMIEVTDKTIEENFPPFTKFPITDFLLKNKQLFISAYGDGLYTTSDNIKFDLIKGLLSKEIYDLEYLEVINSIAVASDKGINLIKVSNLRNISQIKNLPDYIIVDQCMADDGNMIASTYNGSVFKYNPHSSEIKVLFENEDKTKNKKIICNGNKLILHTGNKIYELKNGKYAELKFPQINEKINYTFIDDENNLWLSIGRNKLIKSNLFLINYEFKGPNPIQSIISSDYVFYIGTEDGLIITNKIDSDNYSKMLKGKSITSMKRINNEIWIGTLSHGLYIYDIEKKNFNQISRLAGVDDNTVLDLEKINENQVQVATLAGVKNIDINLKNDVSSIDKKDIIIEAYVYDIFKDSEGDIWYGKDRNGVTLINKKSNQDFKIINIGKKSYKLGSVYSIAQGMNHDIYFSTTVAGLVRYDKGKWTMIADTYSSSEPITSLVKVSTHEMLLIRNTKIELLDLNDHHILPLQYIKDNKNQNYYLNNYTITEDEVYFTINNNIIRYTGNNKKLKKHPTTNIEGISINLERIVGWKNSFSQDENNLQFHYTAAWLSNPSTVQYSYKLEGFDNDWRTTKDRSVSYPHLTPGKYIFKVRASENNNFNDEPIDSYSFEINQAFYNTLWFYYFLALVVIGLLLLQQRRQKNIALLRAELSKKVIESELINLKKQLDPHFLFNTLNTLIGLIEIDPQRGIKYTEQLTDFFRNMSSVSNKELILLKDEIENIRLYKEIVGQRFGNNLMIKISDEIKNIDEKYQLPSLSIQMIVENAIKHNEVSKVNPLVIDIFVKEECIVISNVKNPKMTKEKSLGIGHKNIMDRYKLLANVTPRIEEDETKYQYFLPLLKL